MTFWEKTESFFLEFSSGIFLKGKRKKEKKIPKKKITKKIRIVWR
jgi:hypothetical protein